MTPGHDLEGDAGLAQRLRLLAAAAEDERVAALEAHDERAARGRARSAPRRLVLRQRDVARALARVDQQAVRAREVEQRVAGEAVVDDHVGAPQQLQRRAP